MNWREDIWYGTQVGLRAGLASTIAGWASLRLGIDYPIYAVIAAVVVTDASPKETHRLGLQRFLGTALGSIAGAIISSLGASGLVAMGCSVFLMIFLCDVFRVRSAAKITAYIAGVIVLFQGDSPWIYAWTRFQQTVLGLGSAIAMGYIAERSESGLTKLQSRIRRRFR